MLYIKRNADGALVQVEKQPFSGMTGELAADSSELQDWQASSEIESSLARLRESDQAMIRVLEDLIYALIDKGVLSITDLPEAAQEKLFGRSKARDALSGTPGLIGEEEGPLL